MVSIAAWSTPTREIDHLQAMLAFQATPNRHGDGSGPMHPHIHLHWLHRSVIGHTVTCSFRLDLPAAPDRPIRASILDLPASSIGSCRPDDGPVVSSPGQLLTRQPRGE